MNFDFPKQIAKEIFNCWNNYARYEPSSKPTQRPPLRVLTELLNNCFFASLKQEEGRSTQFTLLLCSSFKLSKPAFRYSRYTKIFNLIRFKSKPPRTLSVNEIVRLAPACDPEKTWLLAEYVKTSGGLRLWGIVDTGANFSELQIRVFGPGEMKIILHGRTLCYFKDGKIFHPERGLINSGDIYKFFKTISSELAREVIAATGGINSEDRIVERDYRAMNYLRALGEIIEKIQQLKHGGCILIVPENKTGTGVNVKYQCQDKTIWVCLRGKLILNDQYFAALQSKQSGQHNVENMTGLQDQRADVENGLRDALETLVRFTAVDGAVLINRKFELLGFGAVIQFGKRTKYKVFCCEDRMASKKQEIRIEKYGTRHRSAFEFCFRNKSSVAIVVSQDGGVKIVTRVGEHIYFWENSLFDISTES